MMGEPLKLGLKIHTRVTYKGKKQIIITSDGSIRDSISTSKRVKNINQEKTQVATSKFKNN